MDRSLVGRLMIVLINWRHEHQTLQCVHALRNWQNLKPTLLVVDNQSTAKSRAALGLDLTTDELICSPTNRGYAGGNNLAIVQTLRRKVDYILLLNTDAEITEVAVTRLLERMEATPGISILGPVIFEGQGTQWSCLIGGRDIARHPITRIVVQPDQLTSISGYPLHEVEYVSGTVFLARTALFEEIGLLDERYFFSGEIADFCRRAWNKGRKACVDLEVQAYHYTDKTDLKLRDSLYLYYSLRNRFLYIRKHYPKKKIEYFSYWVRAGGKQLAAALLKGDVIKARAIFLALTHALSNRLGDQNDKFS